MIDDIYHHQRLEGARLIIEKTQEIAKESGVPIDKIEWDYGSPIQDRDFHILSITSGSRRVNERFNDEELADFPGRVGTRNTIIKIRAMIKSLKQED